MTAFSYRRAALGVAVATLLASCTPNEGDCPPGNLGCTGERTGGPSRNNGTNNGANNGVAMPTDDVAKAVVGEWDLQYTLVARDEVNRPVDVAEVQFTLELYAAEPNEFTGLYDVDGVVRGGTLCALTTDDFSSGLSGCTQVGLTLPGQCAGHHCTEYVDGPISGRYDPETETFEFGRQNLDSFVVSDTMGYVEVDANLYHDALPADGTEVETCGELCTVTIEPAGYYEELYPRYTSETRRSRLVRLSSTARAEPGDEIEREFPVGDASYVQDLLRGEYDLRLLFYDEDDVASVVVGELEYIFEIFEVNPIGTVGDYQWLGALRANAVCWALEAGGVCEPYGPAVLGRCATTCTEEREYAVTGFFDQFTSELRINRVTIDMYAGDSLAYVNGELQLLVEGDSYWDGLGLSYRECTDYCNWVSTPGGSVAVGLPPRRSGTGYALIVEPRE